MKKIISLIILSVVLTVSTLAVIPASADDSSGSSPFGSGTLENIEQTVRQMYNIPASSGIFMGRLADNHHWRNELHFVEVLNFQQAEYIQGTRDIWSGYAGNYIDGCMFFKDSNGDPMSTTVIAHTINNYTDSNMGYVDNQNTYENVSSYFFISEQAYPQYNGLEPREFERVTYKMTEPPDVFTYTISPTNFTLKNGSQGNVTVDIQFTQAYKTWLNTAHERGIDIDGRYNVCVWVSDELPQDTQGVQNALDSARYVKLQYGQYLYEGGAYANELQGEQPAGAPTSAYAQLPDSASTSAMGAFQYWLNPSSISDGNGNNTQYSISPLKIIAEGACITSIIDPAVEHNTVTIASENIMGFDTHKPIYVCVLGAYSGFQSSDITTPDMFNTLYFSRTTANGGVNGCYCSYEFQNGTINMHSYWFPFASAASAVGDGYQGDCEYKAQTVNNQQYQTLGRVTDLTNKSLIVAPDRVHDVEMTENQWVKPSEYKQWQTEHENNKKYGEQFDFNTQSLKDVLDKEGDFFSFLKSAFGIFPDYFMNIFIAFIAGMLVICLLKFIL